jgi:hypothetical protein
MTKFVSEMKGGGMIAGVFEVLSDCGKKFVADPGDRSKGKRFGHCMRSGRGEEIWGRNRKWRERERFGSKRRKLSMKGDWV